MMKYTHAASTYAPHLAAAGKRVVFFYKHFRFKGTLAEASQSVLFLTVNVPLILIVREVISLCGQNT
jgi:hypothetical protein